MRFVATVFLWLVTTVALAAAVPAMWAQKNIVDANGYAAFTQSAAKDPQTAAGDGLRAHHADRVAGVGQGL